MDKRKTNNNKMDIECPRREKEDKYTYSEKEEIDNLMKKHKKNHISYIHSTDWMFTNPNFQIAREHMDNYL